MTIKKILFTLILANNSYNCFSQSHSALFDIKSQTPKNNKTFKDDSVQVIGIKYKKSNKSDIKIYLDGKNITSKSVVRDTSVHYIQKTVLKEGIHQIIVKIKDQSVMWLFSTSSPPKISKWTPMRIMIPKDEEPIISVNFTDIGSGIDSSSISLMLNKKDITSLASISDNSIYYKLNKPTKVGKYEIEFSVSDKSNNVTTKKWGFMITKGNPGVTFLTPNYENSVGDKISFSAEFEDMNSDLVKVLTSLDFDFKDVTRDAVISYSSKRKGKITYEISKQLKPGLHSIILSVANKSGGTANENFEFIVRK